MTQLLRFSDGAWPRSRADLQTAYPLTGFPADISALSPADLAEFDHCIPQPTTPPPFDPVTERVEEVHPVLVDGQWRQAWQIVALPPPPPAPPKPDWDRFQSQLQTSNGFPDAWSAIFTGDARPGISLIASLAVWRATGQWAQFLVATGACLALLPAEQAAHVGLELLALAADCNLDPAFCEALEAMLDQGAL